MPCHDQQDQSNAVPCRRPFPFATPRRCYGVLFVLFCQLTSQARADDPPYRLTVERSRVVLTGKSSRQQLAVTLTQPDGLIRDVTAQCRFVAQSAGVVDVANGVALPVTDGDAVIRVGFQAHAADVDVRVVHASVSRAVSFRTDVAPLLSKAGCNMGACHGNLNGKGGFRLSLRGDDPAFDFQAMTHDLSGRRLSRIAPERSLIVLKPSAALAHEGGMRFGRDSIEARTLLGWIGSGARDDGATAPRIKSLRVFPSERIAAPGALEQQLVVTACFDDGTTRDVTRQAAYDISDPTRVDVSDDGRVHAHGPCETAISVRYMNGRCTSRLAFLADRPGFVWHGPASDHPIDRLLFAKLKAIRINPSGLSTDSEFLRRAYLDCIGRLAEPDEARAFLDSRDPTKRDKLVDRLVERPEFADHWALKWADVLRNEEKTMGAKGAWVFQRWLRDQIARDAPLDELTRRIVAGLGSTWQNPPSSFHRTNRDPMTAAESVGQVFLGIRLQCARCHNHPFDIWTQDDYYGLAAYFGNVARKQLNNVRKDDLDQHEINGDEFIYLEGRPAIVQPRTGATLQPTWLHASAGSPPRVETGNALESLADRLTRNNPQFSRNVVNRVWFHLFGRGIVDPVDDFRDSNPPANPALLDALAGHFEANGMRLKPIVAWIMKSRAYQLSATPDATNADDEANFSHANVRLLPAEALLDAISQVLAVPERFAHAPKSLRAAQLPGPAGGGSFLKTFGKPDRLLTCECERSESTTLAQAFQMINGETVRKKLEAGANRIGRALDSGTSDAELMNEFYLAALARMPTEAERAAVVSHIGRAQDRRKAWEDVVWALLNSKEFLLRH